MLRCGLVHVFVGSFGSHAAKSSSSSSSSAWSSGREQRVHRAYEAADFFSSNRGRAAQKVEWEIIIRSDKQAVELVRRERAREIFVSQLISVAASTSVRMLSNVFWGIASLFVVMLFSGVLCRRRSG